MHRSIKTLSLVLLGILGCEAPPADNVATASGALLTLPDDFGPGRTASPHAGIVGRGFNRRIPITRLEFKPGFIGSGAGWSEHLATDRGLCTEFAGGVTGPSSAGYTVETRATMVKGSASFSRVSNGGVAASGQGNIVLPVEGIPIPVGVNIDDGFSFDMAENASFNTTNATLYAIARGPIIRGSGAPRLRQAIIDSLSAVPASQRAAEFFGKCGDSYLDQVRLGGMMAIDVSIFSADAELVVSLRGKVERGLNLASLGDGQTVAADAGALESLLQSLGISGTVSANGSSEVRIEGKLATVTLRVRSMGPTLPDNLTLDQALDLAKNWGGYVAGQPRFTDLAVMGATLALYAGVDNSNALGVSLPPFVDDGSYNLLMGELNRYFVNHYAKMMNFGFMEMKYNPTDADANAEIWYIDQNHPLPSLTTVQDNRKAALVNAFAVSQAQQCIMALPPVSPTSAYNSCMVQERLGASAKRRFGRVTGILGIGVLTLPTIDVIGLGYGTYPTLNERRGVVKILKTWDDFKKPLAEIGIKVEVEESEDSSACEVFNDGGSVLLRSGPGDDLNPLTGSKCWFGVWRGLDVALRPRWSARASWANRSEGWVSGWPAPTPTRSFPNELPGTATADKELSKWVGKSLTSVELEGPLSNENDFVFETQTRPLSFALDL
jgi:hypothetical protein